jgi:hypothetical protein
MVRPLIVAILTLVPSLAAQPPAAPAAKAPAQRYACPMKCEGDKAYTAEGKCPICGMALKPIATPAFSLTLASAGGPPKGNERTLYNLRIVDASGEVISGLTPLEGAKMNLYVVLRDLASFSHVRPEQQASGDFRFEQTLPPGEYMVYARFLPPGGVEQVLTTSLSVSGKPANPRAMGPDADRPKAVDGVTVTLDGFKGAHAGSPVALTAKFSADGKDIQPEPLNGRPAQLVLISHDRKHLVPAAPGAGLSFTVTPPEPGLYRAWLEFQHAGKASSAAFNFEVAD